MGTLYKSVLLFAMNWLDAQLTVLWVRLNVATEGNALMAGVLTHGELAFLLVKVGVGAFAACVLYRFAHIPLARRGMFLVLAIYGAIMVIHLATALTAAGWNGPEAAITFLGNLPNFLRRG
ncbi:MAG TPA: DUF5658 family protein [Pyrinomonadaceae bacterium]|nr:DUF5658 family protein [Pyrinomonadaceae bacterium]